MACTCLLAVTSPISCGVFSFPFTLLLLLVTLVSFKRLPKKIAGFLASLRRSVERNNGRGLLKAESSNIQTMAISTLVRGSGGVWGSLFQQLHRYRRQPPLSPLSNDGTPPYPITTTPILCQSARVLKSSHLRSSSCNLIKTFRSLEHDDNNGTRA